MTLTDAHGALRGSIFSQFTLEVTGLVGASSAVLSAEYHMDENWTSGLGGVVPDMMPPRFLAALRYTPLMQFWIEK